MRSAWGGLGGAGGPVQRRCGGDEGLPAPHAALRLSLRTGRASECLAHGTARMAEESGNDAAGKGGAGSKALEPEVVLIVQACLERDHAIQFGSG